MPRNASEPPESPAAGQEVTLKRKLGLVSTVALSLGAMIGAGVFVAFGEAARSAGAALPLAVIAAAMVAAFNGLSAAELGAAYPRAGGTYEFAYRLLHPSVGFAVGVVFVFAGIAASATYALTFSNYLGIIINLPPKITGASLVILAIAVNLIGVRVSYRINNVLVALKVLILLAFVVIAAASFRLSNFSPFLLSDLSGLAQATALLFFAYTGYARPVTIAEEVKEPKRNIPWAVGISLASTLLLYLAISVSAVGLAGSQFLGASPAPLSDAVAISGVAFGPVLIAVGAVIATASVLLTEIWGFSRLLFAMSRRADLPHFLERVNRVTGVPSNAVILAGAVLILLTLFVDLRSLLTVSSLALLIYYSITNICALRLASGMRLFPRIISGFGLVSSIALIFSLPLTALLVNAVLFALAMGYHLLAHRAVAAS